MKAILFPFQKLLILFFFIELIFQVDILIFITISLALLILSVVLEGGKPITPFFLMIIILKLFGLPLLQAILIVITGLLVFVLRFYEINVPAKGQYMVGYKSTRIKHQQKQLLIGIYYPTDKKGTKVEWVPEKAYNKTLYEVFYIDPKMKRLPYKIFAFAVSYIEKIWLPVQGETPYLNDQKNPNKNKVIVFSHGLGAHLNAYTSFCANWASHGYTIVTINHINDEVCVDYRKCISTDMADIRKYLHDIRFRDLQIRVSEVKETITNILQKKILAQIINNNQQIDEIILAGHSYGGGTVLATKSTLNKQLNSNKLKLFNKIICLDPWLFPFVEDTFENLKKEENILIINSKFFMNEVPQIYYLEKSFDRVKTSNPKTKAFFIDKMDHLAQCDMAYIFGNLLQLTKGIKYYKYTDYFMALNILLIKQFLSNKSIDQILEKGNQFVSEHKMTKAGIKVEEEYRITRQLTLNGKDKKIQ